MDPIRIIEMIVTAGGILLGYHGARTLNKANKESVGIKTFQDLVKQVNELSAEVQVLRNENGIALSQSRILWAYVYELIDVLKFHKLPIPEPPIQLETDPKLRAIIKGAKR